MCELNAHTVILCKRFKHLQILVNVGRCLLEPIPVGYREKTVTTSFPVNIYLKFTLLFISSKINNKIIK